MLADACAVLANAAWRFGGRHNGKTAWQRNGAPSAPPCLRDFAQRGMIPLRIARLATLWQPSLFSGNNAASRAPRFYMLCAVLALRGTLCACACNLQRRGMHGLVSDVTGLADSGLAAEEELGVKVAFLATARHRGGREHGVHSHGAARSCAVPACCWRGARARYVAACTSCDLSQQYARPLLLPLLSWQRL